MSKRKLVLNIAERPSDVPYYKDEDLKKVRPITIVFNNGNFQEILDGNIYLKPEFVAQLIIELFNERNRLERQLAEKEESPVIPPDGLFEFETKNNDLYISKQLKDVILTIDAEIAACYDKIHDLSLKNYKLNRELEILKTDIDLPEFNKEMKK